MGAADGAVRSVRTGFGPVRALASDALAGAEPGDPVVVAIRPEQLRLGAGDNAFAGTLVDAAYLGDRVRRQVCMADGSVLRASAGLPDKGAGPEVGDTVSLGFAPEAGWVLPA